MIEFTNVVYCASGHYGKQKKLFSSRDVYFLFYFEISLFLQC